MHCLPNFQETKVRREGNEWAATIGRMFRRKTSSVSFWLALSLNWYPMFLIVGVSWQKCVFMAVAKFLQWYAAPGWPSALLFFGTYFFSQKVFISPLCIGPAHISAKIYLVFHFRSQSTNRTVTRSLSGAIEQKELNRYFCRSIQSIDRLIDWLTDSFIHPWIDWLIGRSMDWSIGLSIDWLFVYTTAMTHPLS